MIVVKELTEFRNVFVLLFVFLKKHRGPNETYLKEKNVHQKQFY